MEEPEDNFGEQLNENEPDWKHLPSNENLIPDPLKNLKPLEKFQYNGKEYVSVIT